MLWLPWASRPGRWRNCGECPGVFSPRFFSSCAWGDGHARTVTSVSVTPGCAFDPGRLRLPLAFASPAVAVGQTDSDCRAIVSSEGLPFVAYSSRPSPGHPLLLEPYVVAAAVGRIPIFFAVRSDSENPSATNAACDSSLPCPS